LVLETGSEKLEGQDPRFFRSLLTIKDGEKEGGVDFEIILGDQGEEAGEKLPGVLVGSRVASRVDADRLTRTFAIMLFAVAAYTAVSTVLAV
jgi:hypothetical protein